MARNKIPRRHVDSLNHYVLLCTHFVLHLHGLEHDQDLPGGDGLTHPNRNGDNQARHGCGDGRLHPGLRPGPNQLGQAVMLDVLDPYGVQLACHQDAKLLALLLDQNLIGVAVHQQGEERMIAATVTTPSCGVTTPSCGVTTPCYYPLLRGYYPLLRGYYPLLRGCQYALPPWE